MCLKNVSELLYGSFNGGEWGKTEDNIYNWINGEH